MQNIKEEILKDYKDTVGECLHYTYLSWFRDKEIDIIKKKYNINFFNNYEKFIKQFEKYKIEELGNILSILKIEAENEWDNANRCEAGALVLSEYLKKLS